ncbi:MAG: DUF2892 domain-containing protein [Verrucomicrobiales bacterium]
MASSPQDTRSKNDPEVVPLEVVRGPLPRRRARKGFFSPNIGFFGRVIRGGVGTACLFGALLLGRMGAPPLRVLAALLVVAGIFALIEAFAGWCVARACGVKTKF